MATAIESERAQRSSSIPADIPGDPSTTTELTVDAPTDGRINEAFDQDWYRFTAQGGATYRFEVDGETTFSLTLYDADGNWIAGTWDGHFLHAFAEDTELYVSVGGTSILSGGEVYTLSASELPDDYAASAATTGVVAAGGTVTGSIDYGEDADWFRIEVHAGTTYVFDLEGADSGAGTLTDPWLRLLDADGNEIGGDWDSGIGANARTGLTATVDGVLYIEVNGGGVDAEGNWRPLTGTYLLGVATIDGDIPGSVISTASVVVGESVSGELDFPADGDAFRVEVEAGRTYLFDLEGADSGGGSLADPYLVLLDAEGNELRYDNDGGIGRDAQLGFTAIADGAVYAVARSAWSEDAGGPSTGSYRVSVHALPDDVADSTATTAVLRTGITIEGRIDWGGSDADQDWFRLEVQAGHTYRLELEGVATDAGTLADPWLTLFDDAGNGLDYDDNSGVGTNALLGFTATRDGVVFVQAFGPEVGSYRLVAEDVAGDAGDTADSAGDLVVGATVAGTIDWSSARDTWADRDWYKVVVQAGTTYVFDLEGVATGAGTLVDPRLRLVDADGNELRNGESGGIGSNDRLGFTAAADGIVYLEASAGHALGGDGEWVRLAGTYRLSAATVPDDPADHAGTGGVLVVGQSLDGSIDFAGDHDWYQVEVVAGRSYVIDLEGVDTGRGTLAGCGLALRAADGSVIRAEDDGGEANNARLGFTAAVDGPVFVDASGWRTGTFHLSATEIPADPGDSTASAAPLSIGTPVTGRVDWIHDVDWYRIEVVAGRSYLVDLAGADSAAGTLADTVLRLLDGNGNEIAASADGGEGRDARLGFTATQDGPLYLAAGGESELAGSYRLSVREADDVVDIEDVADNAANAAVLVVGGSLAGTIDWANDRDWFRLEVQAGKTYVLDLEGVSTGAGTLVHPMLTLRDADGNWLGSNGLGGSGTNASLGFVATVDGPVYVEASGWAEEAEGTYRLSARELTGDVPGDATTSASLAVGDSADVLVDHPGDSDWFRVEVEAGKTYRFELENIDSGARPYDDREVMLYDSDGTYIGSDNIGWFGDYRYDPSIDVFLASEDATIFVAASGDNAGQYRLHVTEQPGEATVDPTLRVGGSVSGAIDYPRDLDRYTISVEAGKTYVVDLAGDDLSLSVNGLGISGDGFGAGSSIGFIAPEDGTVTVTVDGYYGEYDFDWWYLRMGEYQLSLREIDGEVAADLRTDAVLSIGDGVTGSIDWGSDFASYDSDWFKFEAEAGQTYNFDLLGAAVGGGTLVHPYLLLLDATGSLIGDSSYYYVEGHAQLTYRAEADTTLFLAAEGAVAPGDPYGEDRVTGSYRLTATVVVDDAGDQADTAGPISAGATISGSIDWSNTTEDVDWYRLEVIAGRTYVVDLEGAVSGAGTLADPRLTLLEVVAEGYNEIGYDEDGGIGSNAQLGFTAREDGAVFIVAGSDPYDADGNWRPDAGTYRLSVREVSDDVGADAAAAPALAVGGAATGTIDHATDKDWFRVAVEAGRSYVFELEGAATGSGSLGGAVLDLFYAGGSVLRHDAGGGVSGNARVTFTPTADGELILAAGGYGEDNLGSYRISAREDICGLWGDLPVLRQRMALPEAAIQASADNAPAGGGEVFATWLGGTTRLDDAVGVCRIDDEGRLSPEIVFASGHDAQVGDAVSLGTVHIEDRLGMFAIADGARRVPGLAGLGSDDLVLRNPKTGGTATLGDDQPPELVRLDGAAPVAIDAGLIFAIDDDPSTPLANPLNPGGLAQATVGSFWRDGMEICRVIAFEDQGAGLSQRDGDFNDAVVAVSVGRLGEADIEAICAWLFG